MAARRPAPRKWEIKRPTLYGQMGPAQFDAPDPVVQERERELAAPEGQPAAAPNAPAPRPAPRGNRGGGFMDSRGFRIVDSVLGGRTITEARDAENAREAAQAQRAEMEALADSLEMGPEERLLFMTDPETWAKVAQSRQEVRTVAGGSTVGDSSGPLWAAPEVGMDGGVPYSLDPMTGQATYDEARPLGPNEQAQAQYRAEQVAVARQKAEEQARHNRAQEGTAASREARQRGGGRGGGGSSQNRSSAPPPWQRNW